MAKRRTKMPDLSAHTFSERDGRELAVSMFHELVGMSDEASIEAQYRAAGTSQVNIVLRYLDTLREKDSRALEAGFGAILTDFISATLDGCVPSPEFYEDFIEGEAANG